MTLTVTLFVTVTRPRSRGETGVAVVVPARLVLLLPRAVVLDHPTGRTYHYPLQKVRNMKNGILEIRKIVFSDRF